MKKDLRKIFELRTPELQLNSSMKLDDKKNITAVKSTLSILPAELKANVLPTLEGINKGRNSQSHPHTQTHTKTHKNIYIRNFSAGYFISKEDIKFLTDSPTFFGGYKISFH